MKETATRRKRIGVISFKTKLPGTEVGSLLNIRWTLNEMRKEKRKQDWEEIGRNRKKNILDKTESLKEKGYFFLQCSKDSRGGCGNSDRCKEGGQNWIVFCPVLCWLKELLLWLQSLSQSRALTYAKKRKFWIKTNSMQLPQMLL